MIDSITISSMFDFVVFQVCETFYHEFGSRAVGIENE